MKPKRDTYQVVTDHILSALETCGPFERPWIGTNLTMPTNAVTGHEYRGSNVLALWVTAKAAGYTENRWATFKQWLERGAAVRAGEKGTPIIWFSMLERRDGDAGDDADEQRIPCARLSWAFNVHQVDGYEHEPMPVPSENQVQPIARADALIAASGARISHAGNQAFYRPSTDEIVLPPQNQFIATSTSTATESYYGVALHELTHWTGPRLQREFGKRFGDQAYAAEELVAELGAAFLCAKVGISAEPRADHASYLASWIKLLKGDRRAFVTASSKAAEAADYLLRLQADDLGEAA